MLYNYKPITASQQHKQYLKTNTQNFPAINFLQLLFFLIMRQNLDNTKKNNIINSSTGSYTSYRENLLLTTKQRAPSNLKSDDSSSATYTAIQPKELPRFRKATSNDLIDTDINTSTYANNYITKSPQYHYNSDSRFILSANSSSSSIKKQQYNTKDLNSTKLQQISKIHNKKERKGYTKHQSNFKKM